MSTAQTSSSSDGGYLSRLYERASHLIHNAGPQSEEQQPLLHGQRSSTEYGSVPENQIPVPKPRKVQSPVKVEAKVWFANEVRTHLHLGTRLTRSSVPGFRGSVLRSSWALFRSPCSILPHTLTLSPFPRLSSRALVWAATLAQPRPCAPLVSSTRLFRCLFFSGVYTTTSAVLRSSRAGGLAALVRICKLTLDDLIGPPLVCGVTFIAILANFIVTGRYSVYGYANHQ